MKNLIKISRNYDARFCWQLNQKPGILEESLTKDPAPDKTNDEIQKKGISNFDNVKMVQIREYLAGEKDNPPEGFESIPASLFLNLSAKDFNKIPASLFLKLSAEKLRALFIDNSGTINFRGNLKAKKDIGLTDLFPKLSNKQQFVVLDGENYAYGARRHDGKIGYGNPKYKAITGGEHIDFFISSDKNKNMSFKQKDNNNSEGDYPNYSKLEQNFAGYELENLTIDQESKEKEKFIKETEYVEEVESRYRELIDFPKDVPTISNDQINSAALKLGINPAIIKAIISVESKGNSGATRFESHIYKKYQNSPLNLNERGLTQMATSFGVFQIMGFNYKKSGFSNVSDMVNAMKTPDGQINAFINLVKNNSTMHTALKNQNWQTFAKLYNGPDYAKNNYDTKISNEYHKFLITG